MEQTWMSYRSEERMIMVDARFSERHPSDLDHLYRLETPMASEGPYGYGDDHELSRFEPFEDALNQAAESAGMVSVGRRRGFGTWELSWYGPANLDRKLAKLLKARPEARLTVTADPDWHHYRQKLLPRGKDLHRARNGLVVWQLLQAGDGLDQPRPIEFFIYFHRTIDRDRYLRDIGSTGLDAEPIEADSPGIRAHFVAAVDVELITDITWELHERAQLSNGEFDGWGCAPVTEHRSHQDSSIGD